MIRRALFAILFASVAFATLPQFVALTRLAFSLRPLSLQGRHEGVMGPFYTHIVGVMRALPPDEPVAIVARRPKDGDVSVFLNYYIAPRPTRVYPRGWRQYGDDLVPGRPRTIVLVDGESVRQASYAEIRDLDFRGSRLAGEGPLRLMSGPFIVPIVCSIDGHSPDSYVSEGTVLNPGVTALTVRFTLQPQQVVKTLTIDAGGREDFYDLVYQLFGRSVTGWLRVEPSAPVQAAFWFVNRGRAEAALLPLRTLMPAQPIRLPDVPGAKLWLLNANDVAAAARVNGEVVPLAPRALIPVPLAPRRGERGRGEGPLVITADAPIDAFLSQKEDTRFIWAESQR